MVTLHVLKALLTGEVDGKARKHFAEMDEALSHEEGPREMKVMYWSMGVGVVLAGLTVWFSYYRS